VVVAVRKVLWFRLVSPKDTYVKVVLLAVGGVFKMWPLMGSLFCQKELCDLAPSSFPLLFLGCKVSTSAIQRLH
jgi:hypothetical protein